MPGSKQYSRFDSPEHDNSNPGYISLEDEDIDDFVETNSYTDEKMGKYRISDNIARNRSKEFRQNINSSNSD